MASAVIVVMEPWAERVQPLLVGIVASGVGPLVGEGAVEALHLPVGLGAVRPGSLVDDGAESVSEHA